MQFTKLSEQHRLFFLSPFMFLVAAAVVVKHLECSFMDRVSCKITSLMTHFRIQMQWKQRYCLSLLRPFVQIYHFYNCSDLTGQLIPTCNLTNSNLGCLLVRQQCFQDYAE